MLLDLSDKVVVVTGAGRGIGRVIAETFVREGSTVVALDLPGSELESFGAFLRESGAEGANLRCDVSDTAAVTSAVDEVVRRFGRIDVLVNNAGINAEGLVEDLDDDLWARSFDINVAGTFRTCRAVIPIMKRQGSGRIINAASFAAIVPSVGNAAYAAAKAAVVQLTRTLAGELGPWNITANSYAPGMIPTSINGFAEMPEGAQSRLLDTLSLRRWGTPDEVAQLLCFLASDAAGYITGALIDVSGGKLATQIPGKAYESAAHVSA
ncbi:SDR family NAD(P)-dependent oxidoreductase [Compostimonas suwonensis]|uniref:3-oxoacyl-[acyl-carrier protein] reductase n=1 Tax=Compostimonas suwonensis TaxID=1048394 RepID=A0A2M9C521_9MICO|nr:SDR family NAD(P)-dependent oxidoreductase [Compostimonas suwonensis]PJJ65631.1 3-oxoacyl-[acyl-carrier protein] reductase [Compostimonas suwonensis]